MPSYAYHIPTADEGACIVLHKKATVCTLYSRMETGSLVLGCWLVWVLSKGHEGSCQLLSVIVSTAVTRQLFLRLIPEIIRGLLGQ
jgi:hypothetical protein